MVRNKNSKKLSKKINRKWTLIFLPILILVLLALAGVKEANQKRDSTKDGINKKESVTRKEWGEGDIEKKMKVFIPEMSTECGINISIPERKFSKKEEEFYIAETKEEIVKSFYQEGEQAEEVYSDVNPMNSYQSGKVEAQWSFDQYECITPEGELLQDKLYEEGIIINASVSLTCGDSEQIYEFAFHVYPGKMNFDEMIRKDINRQLDAQDKSRKEVIFPTSANGYQLVWKEKKEPTWIKAILACMICCVAMFLWKKEKDKDETENKKRQMAMDYPDFLSKLSLLLGAGMTISAALKKMDKAYQKQIKVQRKGKRAVYEELSVTMHEIENGIGEYKAFTEFGERCGIWQYRRFSSLLIQSQRMGNRNLIHQLSDEAKQAFTERKNMAKKLGEEAGTKLLFPMMLMMMLIMGLILVPAYLSIQI